MFLGLLFFWEKKKPIVGSPQVRLAALYGGDALGKVSGASSKSKSNKTAPPRPRRTTRRQPGRGSRRTAVLLDLRLRASILELLLHRLGIGLVDAFLDRRGGPLAPILGFFEAQAGELADHLDHGHLFVRRVLLQSDGELRLLLGRSGRGGAGGARGGPPPPGGGGAR